VGERSKTIGEIDENITKNFFDLILGWSHTLSNRNQATKGLELLILPFDYGSIYLINSIGKKCLKSTQNQV
jgi:hypothetical protein